MTSTSFISVSGRCGGFRHAIPESHNSPPSHSTIISPSLAQLSGADVTLVHLTPKHDDFLRPRHACSSHLVLTIYTHDSYDKMKFEHVLTACLALTAAAAAAPGVHPKRQDLSECRPRLLDEANTYSQALSLKTRLRPRESRSWRRASSPGGQGAASFRITRSTRPTRQTLFQRR